MAKRAFRPGRRQQPQQPASPTYPTLDDPDHGRRSFLVKLGGALLGAGALAACGGRPVNTQPDAGPDGPQIAGGAPPMDAQVDQRQPDAGPDMPYPLGLPRQPDASVDTKPEPTLGKVAPPDALIDCDGGDCPAP